MFATLSLAMTLIQMVTAEQMEERAKVPTCSIKWARGMTLTLIWC